MICTQHLLLGLLAEKDSVAERALRNLDVSAEIVRDAIPDDGPTEA